jgi:tetratricopeptide (TPR) repeat protein
LVSTAGDSGGGLGAAIDHHQAGRLHDAERIYRQILAYDPQNADALNLLGVVTVQLGNPAAAIDPMSRAIALNDGNPTYHFNRGLAYQAMGDREQAITNYRRASELKPDYGDALTNLGNLLLNAGATGEAERCYRRLLGLNPNNPAAHNNLGVVLLQHGAADDAMTAFREAIRLHPDYPEAHNGLGAALLVLTRFAEARDCFAVSLRLKPDAVQTHNNLGLAQGGTGRFDKAIMSFREALRLQPAYVDANVNLGNMYFEQDQVDQAEACYRDALHLSPDNEKPLTSLAKVYIARDQFDRAQAVYDDILSDRPNAVFAVFGKADALERRGQFDDAYALVRPAVDSGRVEPDMATLFGRLARRFDCRDEAVALLERLLANADQPAEARRKLHFGLGGLYDDLDRFDEAFQHYAAGNSLRPTPFDTATTIAATDRAINFFSTERLAALPRAANHSQLPVFIVGMPRSGTSLVEQILANHHAVFGAGELARVGDMVLALKAAVNPDGAMEPDSQGPGYLTALDQAMLDSTADDHLAWLGQQSGDATRVTDKMPYNFQHLGLITRLFPGARIIHCRRDPMDTCLSCYFQNFGRGNFQTFDLGHVGLYYRQYERLMDHWRSVLDVPLLEVNYEAHVADPEATCRRMLNFLDLDWDPNCLAFHESKRVVKTASRDQVRQPIYTRSAGRWRNYENHLEPLKQALADGV